MDSVILQQYLTIRLILLSFEKALKEAIELNIPCVIECDICKDDKVFPMVAPGAPISEAFDRDDLNKKESAN